MQVTISCVSCATPMELASNCEHDNEPGYSVEYWCPNCKHSIEIDASFESE